MRTIYFLVALTLVLFIALMGAAFLYFEKNNHQKYYYVTEKDGMPRSHGMVDLYRTQYNTIYKYVMSCPHEARMTGRNLKLLLDVTGKKLEQCDIDDYNEIIKESRYLRGRNAMLSFLSIARSKFAYLDSIPLKANTLFFSESDIVTWIPLARAYRYEKGGAQNFNCVRLSPQDVLLPPILSSISVTSIRDDYITVDSRRVKTECLVVKEGNRQIGYMWVTKHFPVVVRVELSGENTIIKLTDKKPFFVVKDYESSEKNVVSRDVTFLSNGREVKGVMLKPEARGVYPAVVFLRGDSAAGEGNYGVFADLAYHLAANGVVVLRYRPFALSGDAPRHKWISIKEEHDALGSALSFLEEYRFVDVDKIYALTHMDASATYTNVIKDDPRIKGWIVLSPHPAPALENTDDPRFSELQNSILPVDPDYPNRVNGTDSSTLAILNDSKGPVKVLMEQKVNLSRMRELTQMTPIEDISGMDKPCLVITGKKDDMVSQAYLDDFCGTIRRNTGINSTFVNLRNCDAFMGTLVKDEIIRSHYIADGDMMESILVWLKKNIVEAFDKQSSM